MILHQRLERDYVVHFLRYLSRRNEAPLSDAYELGRAALRQRLTMLDLVRIHHAVLLRAIGPEPAASDLMDLSEAGTAFLCEVLVAYQLVQPVVEIPKEPEHPTQQIYQAIDKPRPRVDAVGSGTSGSSAARPAPGGNVRTHSG